MVEGLCSVWDGQPNHLHERLYSRWAEAGFGMIMTGAAVQSDLQLVRFAYDKS